MALWTPGKEIILFTNPIGRKLLDGLVAYWPLDEASGTRRDLSGNVLTLTDNNSVLSVAGPSSKLPVAAQLNGSSQYLSRVSSALLQTGDIDFTFEIWVYPDSIPGAGVFAVLAGKAGAGAGDIEWQMFTGNANGGVRILVSADGTATTQAISGSALVAGRWNVVRGWHDPVANTVNCQVDLGTIGSASHATGILASAAPLTIGADGAGTKPFPGRVAAANFWKRPALTDREWAYYVNGMVGRAFIPGRGYV